MKTSTRRRRTEKAPAAVIASGLAERDLQRHVVALAKMCGWWVMHHADSIGTEPGWPDLTLIRGDRVLFRELKTEDGKLRLAQAGVAALLMNAGQDFKVWRPSAWFSGSIDQELR